MGFFHHTSSAKPRTRSMAKPHKRRSFKWVTQSYKAIQGKWQVALAIVNRWKPSRWMQFFYRIEKRSHQIGLVILGVFLSVFTLSLSASFTRSERAMQTWHYSLDFQSLLASSTPVLEVLPTPQQANESVPDTQLRVASSAVLASTQVRKSSPQPKNSPTASASASATASSSATASATVTASATTQGDFYVTQLVRNGQSLTSILSRYDISPTTVHKLVKLPKVGRHLRNLQPGREIKFSINGATKLTSLKYQINDLEFIRVKLSPQGYQGEHEKFPVEYRRVYANAKIKHSLYQSGRRAGLTDKIIINLSEVFSWDIDFAQDIRPGDGFELLYENKYVNGKFIGGGNILWAKFDNRGRAYEAIRFKERNGQVNFYTPQGKNLRKAFKRNPLPPSSISSKYSLNRWHPILNELRAHTGVDYAAPRNTPIQATGYGTVIFKGTKGGYGNTVIISHGKKYQTVYAHMNRFSRSVRLGSKVEQGQIIGYVGSTGYSTGPHLHYEFRINGKHTNPQKVKLPSANPLRGRPLNSLVALSQKLRTEVSTKRQQFFAGGDGTFITATAESDYQASQQVPR